MSDCDIWESAKTPSGYGQISIAGRIYYAHRIVWMQNNGHTDLNVLHSCDNPSCVNIEHLRAGDQRENARDMYDRGRHPLSTLDKCPAGHDLIGRNLYVDPKGWRRCRECRRTRWQ